MFRCGRVYLDGEEIDPYALLETDAVCMVEIVDGDYRVEHLTGEADATQNGNDHAQSGYGK